MLHPTTVHDLKTLVMSFHPLIAVETVEEERVRSLLSSVAAELRMPLLEWSLSKGLTRYPHHTAFSDTSNPEMALRFIHSYDEQAIFHFKDLTPHLEVAAVCRLLRDIAGEFIEKRSTVVITGDPLELPRGIDQVAVKVELQAPSEEELRNALAAVVQSLRRSSKIDIQLGKKSQKALIDALSGLTLNQARQAFAYAIVDDGKLDEEDIETIIQRKAKMIHEEGILEYFPVEDNHYEIGGFDNLKRWLERAKIGFTDEARALNLSPPRGLLFVGVQGCGKSLAAKIIARTWGLPLLKLDAGRLYDKYIGESERNFRKAISMAESMAPVVMWIDEIEKAFVPSGSLESDGGLSRRLFGSFLTWLQEKRAEVFVVGCANDLFAMPPELLRKGRFDEIFFVDLPNTPERSAILAIHLRLRKQDPANFDLSALTEATDGFSGAEIEQAIVSSLYRSLHQKKPIDTALLLEEISSTIPLSITRREDIERLRETSKGRFVSVR